MACQVGLVLSEALLLVLSLRFTGVPASAAPTVTIVVALLVSYPLTALPFGGVGVLDAAVIAILGLEQGPFEAAAVAGLVVFRVCWMLVPLALGAATVTWWRRGHVAEAAALRSATREG
jgi:uncharacterized membrane protein YbhN (UPF0104 family)